MGTPNHRIGSPPQYQGMGKPPKFRVSSSRRPSSNRYSFGPAKIATSPSQALPGAISGVARTPIVTRPGIAFCASFATSGFSTEVTRWKPPVFGMSAARYHTLPIAIQSPSRSSLGGCSTSPSRVGFIQWGDRSTALPTDQTTSIGCCPGNFSGTPAQDIRDAHGSSIVTLRADAEGFSMRTPTVSPASTRLSARPGLTDTLSAPIVIGTGAAGALEPDDTSSPAGPRSPTMTTGFSPRYLRLRSWNFPPSLLTTAR